MICVPVVERNINDVQVDKVVRHEAGDSRIDLHESDAIWIRTFSCYFVIYVLMSDEAVKEQRAFFEFFLLFGCI